MNQTREKKTHTTKYFQNMYLNLEEANKKNEPKEREKKKQ